MMFALRTMARRKAGLNAREGVSKIPAGRREESLQTNNHAEQAAS
jgi:hypothetical protein